MIHSHEPWVLPLAVSSLLAIAACGGDDPSPQLDSPSTGVAGRTAASGGGAARAAATGAAGSSVTAPGNTAQAGKTAAGFAGTASAAGAHAAAGATSAAAAGSGGVAAVTAGVGAAAGSGRAGGGALGAAGATAGSSGVAAGAMSSDGATTPKPRCKTSPKQVIVLGDSYLNWITHTFPDDLAREAAETWRMYAVGGCSLGSGGLCLIPPQLDQAIMEDKDIIASVMTGGGNDILIVDEDMFPGGGECKDRTDSATLKVCQDIVATAIAAGEKLMQSAADAGIRDVIYMFYPHTPGGGFGGMNPKVLLDYASPKAEELCDKAEERTHNRLRCHFIDLVPIFEGHPDWFADDGIHENSMGSAAMAKEVVKVAKDKCVAQPASSGCCEP